MELGTCEELSQKMTSDLTVTYFGDFEGELWDKFTTASKSHDKYKYFNVPADCGTQAPWNAPQVPGLMLTRPFEESPLHYSGEVNEHSILFWMEVMSLPAVVEFSQEHID